MDLMSLYELISNKVDIAILALIISIGEIVKRYWKSEKTNSFYKVLLTTLPISILYTFLSEIKPEVFILSYLMAFWLYPLLIKPILSILGYKKNKRIGGELPDNDDEQ